MPDVVTGSAVTHATTVAASAVEASAVATDGGTMQAIYVSIMAFSIVFAVLIVVAALMILLGKIVDGAQKTSAASTAKPAFAPAVRNDSTVEIDEETVAVITAAVSMCMKGRRFRVASLAGYDVQTARWAMAGRQRLQRKKG